MMADDAVLSFLIEVLEDAHQSNYHISRKFGMCVTEVLQGLNNLLINEDNKHRLVSVGCLSIYVKVIEEGSKHLQGQSIKNLEVEAKDEETELAVSGLWKMSFHRKNKPIIKGDKQCMTGKATLLRSIGAHIVITLSGVCLSIR